MTTITGTDRLIRTSLRANAFFSGSSGLVAVVAANPLADATDLPALALRLVGVGLAGYAVMLWTWANRPSIRAAEGWTAVVGDVAWVVGTAVLLLAFPDATNGLGTGILIVVAVIVAGFAEAQFMGLRRLAD